MTLSNNRVFDQLVRSMDEATRDFYNGTAALERTKLQLAEFVLLNKDIIDQVDLSAYHEQCDDARLTIEIAERQFNEAKDNLVALIQSQRIS